jgi:hypothetical protein
LLHRNGIPPAAWIGEQVARQGTAKSNGNSKWLSIAEQENSILAVYADMVEHDNLDGMFDLMRHAGIALRPDPTTAILRHYWLGFDRGYDVKRAIEDFASWPPIVARCEELRRERRARRAGRAARQ